MANLYKQISQLDLFIESKESEIEFLKSSDIHSYRHAKNELIDLLLTHRDISSKIIEGQQCNKK